MDAAQRAGMLMRERPPEATLAWLVRELDAVEVVEVTAMRGGSTSAMHHVVVRGRDDVTFEVVLRRYVLNDYLTAEPGVVEREARALELVAALCTPTPRLLAVDVTGEVADVPAVVMGWLDGRPVWETRSRESWVSQVVDAMIELHQVDHHSPGLTPLATYLQANDRPPSWTRRHAVWERAIEVFHGPIPAADVGFVHRDFNPGNVLWVRGALTGVVDWQAACVGPRSIDPAHCRLNLFRYDPGMADDVRRVWERRSGLEFDPWADIVSIIGSLDELSSHRHASTALHAIENALAHAVATIG
jgi:aminoglycoside phosphotransferase (APT) family kinase protein